MCRPQRIELLAQNRHHLTAQHLQLLEDGAQWKAGVIHQKHLALVITEVLPEFQGLLDHLLRTADCQWRLLGEFLE